MSAFLWVGGVPVIYQSVHGIQQNHSWNLAKQSTVEGIPRQQFIGKEGDTLRLNVRAHYMLGLIPSIVKERLLALGDAGEVFSVQVESGEILGWYMLSSLSEDRVSTLDDGTILHSDLSLSLEPERPLDEIQRDEPEAVNVEPQYDQQPEVIDLDRDPDDVSIDEILRRA